ncbi:MAG: LCP family protein [Spirochaetales bacterium]|nr:LCP family protein [Spirochaetales bacterium]
MKERSSKSTIFLILIIAVAAAAIIVAIVFIRTNSVEERVKKGQAINALFTVREGGRLKLIEVLLFQPASKKAVILFLPQRTWLMLESLNRYDTLETLYVPGNPARLRAKVAEMIGVPIQYSIDFDADGLRDLVDLMGGIEVFVSSTVDKQSGGRRYLFDSGSVLLDGDKATDYLSLDLDNESDMDRVQRRQDFLKSLIECLAKGEASGFLSKPGVFGALQKTMRTNLSAQELGTYLSKLQDLNLESILYRRVHGTTRMQNKEEIYIPNDQGEQLKKSMQQAVEFLQNNQLLRPEDLVVNLEILNGTDIAFRARDCARIYKKYGYEVLREDNAPEKPEKKTVVIDHRGNQRLAQEIAAVIKCRNIETSAGDKTAADITIILGMDFDGQYCQ